jgi:hypothetical protein
MWVRGLRVMASPHTLKRKSRELLDAGWISTHGKGRGVFYRRK